MIRKLEKQINNLSNLVRKLNCAVCRNDNTEPLIFTPIQKIVLRHPRNMDVYGHNLELFKEKEHASANGSVSRSVTTFTISDTTATLPESPHQKRISFFPREDDSNK